MTWVNSPSGGLTTENGSFYASDEGIDGNRNTYTVHFDNRYKPDPSISITSSRGMMDTEGGGFSSYKYDNDGNVYGIDISHMADTTTYYWSVVGETA